MWLAVSRLTSDTRSRFGGPGMDALSFSLVREVSPPVLSIEGEIDMATADALRAALEDALAENPDLVVDLQGVTFLDASGIRVFLGAAAGRNGTGPLRFVHARRLQWL